MKCLYIRFAMLGALAGCAAGAGAELREGEDERALEGAADDGRRTSLLPAPPSAGSGLGKSTPPPMRSALPTGAMAGDAPTSSTGDDGAAGSLASDDGTAPGAMDSSSTPPRDETCDDGNKGALETGTDCGGPDCDPCPPGQGCIENADCTSGVCGTDFLCVGPTCDDGATNGDESGVDCGGDDCSACPDGESCTDGHDCQSGSCTDEVCVCEPRTQDDCDAAYCGELDDGCGGTVACPDRCTAPVVCHQDMCCTPKTQADCDPGVCGGIDDGCGGRVRCPACEAPAVCHEEMCCMPKTGADCTADACGTQDDGCGGTYECPDQCGERFECGAGGLCEPLCVASECPDCGLLGLTNGCCRDDGACGCPGGLLRGGTCE